MELRPAGRAPRLKPLGRDATVLVGGAAGCSGCSLAAVDLNRRWAKPSMRAHPTICAFKRLLQRTHAERSISLFVDLHGHSRKHNVFMYGCAERTSPLLQQAPPTVKLGTASCTAIKYLLR